VGLALSAPPALEVSDMAKRPTRDQLKNAAEEIGINLKNRLPKGVGFFLLFVDMEEDHNLATITNIMPKTAVLALRKAADIHEEKAASRKNPPKAKA
jgi:hypothetical protein